MLGFWSNESALKTRSFKARSSRGLSNPISPAIDLSPRHLNISTLGPFRHYSKHSRFNHQLWPEPSVFKIRYGEMVWQGDKFWVNGHVVPNCPCNLDTGGLYLRGSDPCVSHGSMLSQIFFTNFSILPLLFSPNLCY